VQSDITSLYTVTRVEKFGQSWVHKIVTTAILQSAPNV
jgi:hypothetical protein